jgi:tRNA (adenine57-N1/adenine58-N1)-methyltransferase
MRPQLDDYVLGMPRGAAIVYPKDAARIVTLADVGDGSSVIEAGAGSGALTCFLVRAAGSHGRVLSIEARADFADIATENVRRWFGGTPRTWSLQVGTFQDCARHVAAESVNAVVLDLLAPWECLSAADHVLVSGGSLVVYVATTTQMSRLVEDIRMSRRWVEPRAEELLLRTWHLDGLSVRPDHRMNGHTGFVVSTRRMAPHSAPPRRHRRPAPGAYGSDYPGPGAIESSGD